MIRLLKPMLFLLLAALVAGGTHAQAKGSADEAVQLVRKAAAAMKANGRDTTYREINTPGGTFHDRDLYIFVYDMNGLNLATGNNSGRMVGKNMMDLKDADGKFMMREMLELAKAKGRGWVDYRWVNPVTKQIEKKSSYIERFDDIFIGCGIYRQ